MAITLNLDTARRNRQGHSRFFTRTVLAIYGYHMTDLTVRRSQVIPLAATSMSDAAVVFRSMLRGNTVCTALSAHMFAKRGLQIDSVLVCLPRKLKPRQ